MKVNIKILFVAPALSMGGMERAAVNTANGLHELGCEVLFLSLFKKEHFFKLHPEIRLFEPKNFNQSRLSIVKSIKWIRNLTNIEKPHVVLVFNKFYGAITAISILGIKVSYFLSERSSPLYKWNFPINSINRFAYWLNPPKGVIAQTQIAAEYQQKYFKMSEIKVIPNSVREVILYPTIKKENVILAVGRLNDYLKGFDLLLDAFSKLENKEWKLHLAGGDEEEGQVLKEQAKFLGVFNRVKFLGKVKEIDKCYAYAGIYVIPSRSEGFPNSLAEAMAAGCCCVAFDFVAGPRDLITHEQSGFIVPNGDTLALSETMDELINDLRLRKKFELNAIEIRNKLSISNISVDILNFINKH
jgi:GalNAc-alpha-(1->4)-GalNAc-alpha-(1->3)-diNAcBac-PP-undecaprenol alpha-1,4-N-acetyl-D-galactosaminyltransferase